MENLSYRSKRKTVSRVISSTRLSLLEKKSDKDAFHTRILFTQERNPRLSVRSFCPVGSVSKGKMSTSIFRPNRNRPKRILPLGTKRRPKLSKKAASSHKFHLRLFPDRSKASSKLATMIPPSFGSAQTTWPSKIASLGQPAI